MVGGYKVIDLGGVNLADATPVEVQGIYNAVEASIGKPLLIRNFAINGKEIHAAYSLVSMATVGGTTFRLVYSIRAGILDVLDITSSDNVVSRAVANATSAGSPPTSDEDGPSASM